MKIDIFALYIFSFFLDVSKDTNSLKLTCLFLAHRGSNTRHISIETKMKINNSSAYIIRSNNGCRSHLAMNFRSRFKRPVVY